MNLVIHDLSPERWERIRGQYSGWSVITDNGRMQPCIGCFACWNRTPGQCALRDGYEDMGKLIHEANEVVVISRYTYGGFSGSVKNAFDRSLGYVLPQFELTKGETHHKKRYDEDKPFTFVFYGSGLTGEEKESARRYVEAVCTNIRGYVKDLVFEEQEDAAAPEHEAEPETGTEGNSGRTVLLNGSMRSADGNSAKLARKLREQLAGKMEILNLRDYRTKPEELIRLLQDARKVVLCVPLYVDGLPSQVIRFLEACETQRGGAKKIYVLANMGLYESVQLRNLFDMVRQWCRKMGYEYCGGLGVSAGELLGTLMEVIPFRMGPTKKAAEGMARLAEAIRSGSPIGDIYAEPFRSPRSLYILIANVNWNRTARKNGLQPSDLYRRL